MLKIVANPTFTQTVKVLMPTDGGVKEHSFKARFRALRSSEAVAMPLHTGEGTTEFLQSIFVGWEGLADEDGNPLPYNDETRDLIIDLPYMRQVIVETYFDAVSGVKGARRGN